MQVHILRNIHIQNKNFRKFKIFVSIKVINETNSKTFILSDIHI